MVEDRDNEGLFSVVGFGSAAQFSLLKASAYVLWPSPGAVVNKDSVLVCRDPEKTRCCGFLGGLAASFSNVDTVRGVGISPPESVFNRREAGNGCSCSTCRIPLFFLLASKIAQCFFSPAKSLSAF